MKQSVHRRLVAMLLVVVMVISMAPVIATAEGELADHVVINQAYGGGGNSGAVYTYDFVELYNPTDEEVDLTGWSIQYASKAGTFGNNTAVLNGKIAAKGYFLIQLGKGSNEIKELPTPDCTPDKAIAMSGTEFKIALVSNSEAISGKDDADVVDFLGVGAADTYEGSAAAPKLSNSTAALRNTDGVDTDDNAADFSAKTPNPRNSKGDTPAETTPAETTTAPAQSEASTKYEKVASVQAGDVVVLYNAANGKLVSSTKSGYKLSGVDASVTDNKIATDDTTVVWTVGKDGEAYTFTQGEMMLGGVVSGTYINPSTNAADGHTGWNLTAANEANNSYFIANATLIKDGYDGVYLEWYNGFTLYGSNSPAEDAFGFQFFKLVEEGAEPPVTTPAETTPAETTPAVTTPAVTTPAETTPPAEEPAISTIAQALAGADGTSFTVKGVVTLVDGKNIYVQDATGGICVRMSNTPSDITLGDTIIGTGSKTVYNGLPQLGSGTYEKSEGLTLSPKTVTDISALTTADICCYIKLVNVEITEVYDNNGGYSTPNITVQDASGNKIQLYKAVTTKTDGAWDWKVGDKVNITCAVSAYNTTLQLRNTLATEITPYVEPENHIVTDLSELTDGAKVVIFNPANMMALSQNYSGFYNTGVAVTNTDGVLAGYEATEIWTVGVNTDGSYTFSTADGKKFSMGASYSSTPLDDVNPNWNILSAATADCFYIQNTARGSYVEWYSSKGNWSSYGSIGNNEALFAQQFYLVVKEEQPAEDGLPKDGDQVVIYNVSAEGVLAAESDNQSINNAAAVIADGKATVANGGVVFTVQKNGDYFRFYNETYGYLCSNGTGNNAFYSLEASEDADWTLSSGKKGGYNLESRTAKYNGTYSQYLEYYADSYKTYSMYNVTDYDIYEFFFYPCANEKLTGGIVNEPQFIVDTVSDAFIGADFVLDAQVDAPFGVKSVSAGDFTVTTDELGLHIGVTAAQIEAFKTAGTFDIVLTGVDNKDVEFTKTVTVTIKDEPQIGAVSPASGSETGTNLKPTIEAVVSNAGENPTVTMTVGGVEVTAAYANGKITYTPDANLTEGRTTVTVTVTRADGKTAEKTWTFTAGKAQYQLYFGQLHSHTTYSDGSGSLTSALEYVKNLPESANVDFVAFTDHSNYFDSKTAINPEAALYDRSQATAASLALWDEYVGTILDFNASQSDIVAIPGFEMTWSGGPGHINTFNTPGIVSRNNTTLNNKTGDAGMKAYYALLSNSELSDSISQFNHPGSTFGTFSDFSYWDAVIDSRFRLVEVGNGEGQIGAGGYYPSYEYYTMALDKGWHVAPTNNQDNHKGKWGNANDARDVILTDDFTLEGIYQAIRDRRVYATEDKNLEIYYTVNGYQLGSIIEEVPEKLNIHVVVSDPDSSDSISKVEVIVNSGKVAHTWSTASELAAGELSVELEPIYSYYYIKVTQGDGDLAVTAPVWVGETLMLGISSVECGTSTPVTGEELTLTTTLFNSESSGATVKSLTYAIKGGAVIGTDTTGYTVPASGTLAIDYKYTPDKAKVFTVTVTAVVEQDGVEYIFTKDIELDIENADNLVYIGIDASHYNEYVNGNYKDSMGNFGALAAEYSVRTVTLNTSEDLIAACNNENGKYKAIILTAPSRRSSDAQNSNPLKVYTEAELAAIQAFNRAGGMVILAGWSDHYEDYPDVDSIKNMKPEEHMAATQNAILEALGSSLRIADDATYDDSYNGGQAYRLYFSTYGDNVLTQGVEVDPENPHDRLYTEVFSHYGGASVYVNGSSTIPSTVSPVVFGHASTYSVDTDSDGLGGSTVSKYAYAEGDERLMIMAYEQLPGQGMIIVSGAAFMSNFEVQATVEDSGSEKNYSNYRICQNLLNLINPVQVTDIRDVQSEQEEGVKFTIEGIVTSNASGFDKNTAFFDCIYVQDSTAGINAFPVAGTYKIGDKVRITGTTSSYQGERQIAVESIELISEGNDVAAEEVTAEQINDGSKLGSLVTLKGTVVSFEKANGLVQTIMVRDANGKIARVFIDGYVTTSKEVEGLEVGCDITVTGCASYDNTFNAPDGPFPRIRIRNRADVVCTPATDPSNPGTGDSTNVTMLAAVMLLSMAAFVAILPRRKENA
ncbi:MAG: CehA/McbA family metallohydrolase [Faecousia sp.]